MNRTQPAKTLTRNTNQGETSAHKKQPPWYKDIRLAFGILSIPVFLFSDQIVGLLFPAVSAAQANEYAQAVHFISGAITLFPLVTLIEQVTEYYEHNFHHSNDRFNALLRAGLLHTTFTNIAFLILTLLTLSIANSGSSSSDLIRIVQVSIAGSFVVSILFNLGLSIFIGGFNINKHKGRMHFSKELANQDSEMIAIAVIILSLPTLANRFNISPSFLDNLQYKVPTSTISNLSVIISFILIFIYVSYTLWTLFKLGDRQKQTNDDVEDTIMKLIFRAVRKVLISNDQITITQALRNPTVLQTNNKEIEADTNAEIQDQIDDLDIMLEEEEEEDFAHKEQLRQENLKRKEKKASVKFDVMAPATFIKNLFVAIFYIAISPFVMIFNIVKFPVTVASNRRKQKVIIQHKLAELPDEELLRRAERNKRIKDRAATKPENEHIIHVIGRISLLIIGGAGAVFVLDQMAHSIEGGLIEGLGLNPFFVGFIVLPIATGLVDIATAVRKAWNNDLQNSMAITTGSAIQTALLIGPLILLLSRFSLIQLPDINLVFGLFILAVFALIAYIYQIITIDGETTWFEGAQMLGIFMTIAVVVFFAKPS